MANIRYQIDGGDLITTVSDSWSVFAMANDAPKLAQPPVGRAIWDSILGGTTREVYRQLFARVRQGRTVTFPYRCDAPGLRRFLRMQLSPSDEDGIDFDSSTVRTEPRHPIQLAPGPGRDAGLVTICSWCKRVAVGREWVEVEVAVQRLNLFGATVAGAITHGACTECLTLIFQDDDVTPTTVDR